MDIDWKNYNKPMKTRTVHYIALLVALFGALSSSELVARDWFYTVRNDDSLWKICSTYVERRLCYIELAEYNKVARGDVIAPGSVIQIPYAWLKNAPQPALVVYSRGEVKYLPAAIGAKLPWQKAGLTPGVAGLTSAGVSLQPLPADRRIFMGDRIVTGEGNVRVEFGDGSQMVILPDSDVTFDRISSKGHKRFVDTLLILKRGSTTNRVTPQPAGATRFNIKTPAGVAAVRGTEFRVRVASESSAVMRSEVLAGTVAVADPSAASEQTINEGFGVRNEAGKPIPPPRELLPAPTWQGDPGAPLTVPVRVGWDALPGAEYYLVDLLDADGLIETRRVERHELVFESLADGEYRLRARGVDEIGLQGLEAERTLSVITPLPIPELTPTSMTALSRTTMQLNWAAIASAEGYLVEFAGDPDFTEVIATRQTVSPAITYKSRTPVYVRVSALYADAHRSEPGNTIEWQPDTDYTAWIIGGYIVLVTLILL